MSYFGRRNTILVAAALLLFTIIFVADVNLPLGVAGGVPYIAVVALGALSRRRGFVVTLASIATMLTIVGYFLSPGDGANWIVYLNRGLAIFAIWVGAVFILFWRTSDELNKRSEVKFEILAKIGSDWFWETDVEHQFSRFQGREKKSGRLSEKIINPLIWRVAKKGEFCEKIMRDLIVEHLVARRSIRNLDVQVEVEPPLWLRISGEPMFDDRDRFIGYLGVATDCTEQKNFEATLVEAREKARLANLSKSEFLANMSHELRTPLNAMLGFSEILVTESYGSLNEKQTEYLTDISNAGTHLLSLINDILDLSKIELGQLPLKEEEIDLRNVFRWVESICRERAASAEVELTMIVEENVPLFLADPKMIRQILTNLVFNSIKFTPSHGKVRAHAEFIQATGIHFSILDNGIGISEIDIPKALSMFGQVDGSLARSHEGTGLGLPLAKQMIELHGGELVIESECGDGTNITFNIPQDRVVPMSDTDVFGLTEEKMFDSTA